MKLLLDANLSWRLAATLQKHFTACLHVDTIDLPVPATDHAIWNYAKENEFLIVTNDEDFLDLVNLRGFPPKVILLRTGNQSTLFIANLLILRKENILSLYESQDYGLLEII